MFKSIITALIVVQSCFGSGYKFEFDGALGIIPRAAAQEYNAPNSYLIDSYKNVFYMALMHKSEYKFIYGTLDVKAYSSKQKEHITFKPFQIQFENEFGLYKDFGNLRVTAAWNHVCSHRIAQLSSEDDRLHVFDKYIDKIYLRFSYKN